MLRIEGINIEVTEEQAKFAYPFGVMRPVRRSWLERLFSWPWRPWKKVRWVPLA